MGRGMVTPDTPVAHERRPLLAVVIAALVGLILGYAALLIVNAGIALVWETIPEMWGTTPAWYVIGVLVLAAVLVYVIRTHVGDAGHAPLGGIAISPLTPREYVGVILAILASLLGGVVLGPEVALVATGSVVGTVIAKRMRFTEPEDAKKIVGAGALGGSLSLDGAPDAVELDQLAWAIVVAIIATLAVAIARVVAALLARVAGSGPHLGVLVGASLVIAGSALAVQYFTGESVLFVVTSGEEMITELPTLTSVSTVALVLAFKALAYAVSLGAGFRGGPFFPAMFVGATAGLLAAVALPSGPSISAAMVVGVVAAVIATAPMKWPIAIVLGIVIGFVMGTWTLVPAALVGAVVARAIPRWADRMTPSRVDAAH